MITANPFFSLPWLALGSVLLLHCGWENLDAIGGPAAAAFDDAGGVVDASAGPDDAPIADGVAALDGESGVLSCNLVANPLTQWTFDANVQGWTLAVDKGVQASLTWTGSTGLPSAGALRAAVTPNADDGGSLTGAWAHYDMSSVDLSNRTLSAWVWLDSGTTPNLKVYVQTGSQYVWADGGTVHLRAHEWTCVSMAVSSPAYNQANYDPTNAIRIGFELLGPSPFTLFIDTVSVQ
jgi:hypothetical protein